MKAGKGKGSLERKMRKEAWKRKRRAGKEKETGKGKRGLEKEVWKKKNTGKRERRTGKRKRKRKCDWKRERERVV